MKKEQRNGKTDNKEIEKNQIGKYGKRKIN